MSMGKLAQEILAEADKKASANTAEGMDKSRKIISEAKKQAQAQARKINGQTQKILAEIEQTEMSALSLALNKKTMEAKKAALDEIFESAKKEIASIDKNKRAEIVRELCKKALLELPEGKFAYSNEEDRKAAGAAKGLAFKGIIVCLGGVIVENSDGSIRVNCTFEEVLEKIKEENIHGIASRVF